MAAVAAAGEDMVSLDLVADLVVGGGVNGVGVDLGKVEGDRGGESDGGRRRRGCTAVDGRGSGGGGGGGGGWRWKLAGLQAAHLFLALQVVREEAASETGRLAVPNGYYLVDLTLNLMQLDYKIVSVAVTSVFICLCVGWEGTQGTLKIKSNCEFSSVTN